jgi:hypothetical protein
MRSSALLQRAWQAISNSSLSGADFQLDSAKDMPLLKPLMRLGRLRQRIGSRNRHPKSRFGRRTIQMCKMSVAWLAVVSDEANLAATLRLGLYAIRVCHSSVGAHEVEATFEFFAAREGKNGVYTARRE